jgi:hypothetical protein
VHTPVQEPVTHAELTQATAEPHCPDALQVCTPLPEHCMAPGEHTPVHEPLAHAWFEQVVPFCQVPVASHV